MAIGNAILPKFTTDGPRQPWTMGLPSRPKSLDLTPAEQTFLARYSEHGDRVQAVHQAGLLPTADPDAHRSALADAHPTPQPGGCVCHSYRCLPEVIHVRRKQ